MNPYIAAGTEVALMLGRQKYFERISRMLTKPTPDHVSVVGPKLYGKTVLLWHIANSFRAGQGGYLNSVYLDLRHSTPESDGQFNVAIAQSIHRGLSGERNNVVGVLSGADEETCYDLLELALDQLASDSERILLVLDGFDYLPLGTGISPNLLDQIRNLAQKPSLRLVTGSRLRLRDLCKTEESRTSDFWRIFSDPVLIGRLDEEDLELIWDPFRKASAIVEKGAITALSNWTGGIPTLACCILNRLYSDRGRADEKIGSSDVDHVCDEMLAGPPEALDECWEALNNELKQVVIRLGKEDVPLSEASRTMRNELVTRGIASESHDTLKTAARLLIRYAETQSSGIEDLSRLFGNECAFEKNVGRVLEMRLESVEGLDESMKRYIRYAVSDLCEDPRRVLDSARGIVEATLDLILKVEGITPGQSVPEEWKRTWVGTQNVGIPEGIEPIPSDRGKQCRLIRYVTGRNDWYFRVAKCVSRQTSMLLDQLSSFGNFVNHRSQETASFGTACTMCFTAIELARSLTEDLTNVS